MASFMLNSSRRILSEAKARVDRNMNWRCITCRAQECQSNRRRSGPSIPRTREASRNDSGTADASERHLRAATDFGSRRPNETRAGAQHYWPARVDRAVGSGAAGTANRLRVVLFLSAREFSFDIYPIRKATSRQYAGGHWL